MRKDIHGEIPFGFHNERKMYVDATSVPNGRKCNCICANCGKDLEAVHPAFRRKYFRHVSLKGCKGALESLFHKTAKQILQESTLITIPNKNIFNYTECNIEFERHGKRPDAYLSNQDQSLLVEIFFTHHTEDATIEIYKDKGERILEIDISEEKMQVFSYERLKSLVLNTAPRKFIGEGAQNNETMNPTWENSHWWKIWLWILLGLITLGLVYHFKKQKRKARRHRRRY